VKRRRSAGVAFVALLLAACGDDGSRDAVAPTAVNVLPNTTTQTSDDATADSAISTTSADPALPTTTPATTSTGPGSSSQTTPPTTADELEPIAVSYLDLPPVLELEAIATVEVAFDSVQGSPAAAVVALERGRIAVIDLVVREIVVVDPGADDRRVGMDPALPDVTGLAVGGPGDVVYAVLQGGRQTPLSATEIVAIPTDGPRAGQIVASAPIDLTYYTHTHESVLGLGATGVVDKRTGEKLIDFVDATGEPLRVSLRAPLYPLVEQMDNWTALEEGLNVAPTRGAAPMWCVEVDREPSSTSGLSNDPEPTAISGEQVLVTTAIGTNLPGDYGEPTQPVVAILQPDGMGAWWSVPDDWRLSAADLYGVVYERTTDTTIEIARPSVLQG
jgi:hypothetical protein